MEHNTYPADLVASLKLAYNVERAAGNTERMDLVVRALMYATGGERGMALALVAEHSLTPS